MAELRMEREVVFCERPPFPKNMLLELTNICNQNCIFCGYSKMQRKKCMADKALMFDIMQQAYENGTREIGFYMMGEPLLNPDVADYVAKAKELGFEYIYLTTNGVLAKLEIMKKLIDAGLSSIKFSINAGSKDTYMKIHGKDDFESVVENVKALAQYIKEKQRHLAVFVSCVKTEYNKHETALVEEIFGPYVDRVYIYPCINQGGDMLELVEKGVVQTAKFVGVSTPPCSMIFNRFHITSEGYLAACCNNTKEDLVVADLRETSVVDAWYSEPMIRIRKEHLTGNISNGRCYRCVHGKNLETSLL